METTNKSRGIVSNVELLGLRIDKNGSALWTIPPPGKRLSASMKNRFEDAKLKMYKSILEKHAFRSRFELEKVSLLFRSLFSLKCSCAHYNTWVPKLHFFLH